MAKTAIKASSHPQVKKVRYILTAKYFNLHSGAIVLDVPISLCRAGSVTIYASEKKTINSSMCMQSPLAASKH